MSEDKIRNTLTPEDNKMFKEATDYVKTRNLDWNIMCQYNKKYKETGSLTSEEVEHLDDIVNKIEPILAEKINWTLEEYRNKIPIFAYVYNRKNKFVFDEANSVGKSLAMDNYIQAKVYYRVDEVVTFRTRDITAQERTTPWEKEFLEKSKTLDR